MQLDSGKKVDDLKVRNTTEQMKEYFLEILNFELKSNDVFDY